MQDSVFDVGDVDANASAADGDYGDDNDADDW